MVGGVKLESERSSVDIGNTLDTGGAPARKILFLGVTQRPPVVTRFGRLVKVGYLEKIRCTPEVVGYPAPVGY